MSFRFSAEFLGVLLSAQVAFSKRSWPYVLALVVPWIMTQGQRTVTKLKSLASYGRSLSSYYRFLSHGKVRIEVLWRSLFKLIVSTFGLEAILIVADDSLCPKWGRHIFGTASFFDHVARPRPGFIWGHNWVVLAIVVTFRGYYLALPFWVQLYRVEKDCRKGEFRTRLQIVVEVLKTVRKWTFLPMMLVADGAYYNAALIRPLCDLGIPVISRLRSDAVLRADPVTPIRRRRGRPATYGPRLPELARLARQRRGWKKVVVHIYRSEVTLLTKVIDAWWPACGMKIRVLIVRDPKGRHRTCFLSSTDCSLTAETIIEIFAKRWTIEQLFSDVKEHLGLDSAEVRSERSVIRHAALTFGFATWVHVWHYLTSSPESQVSRSKTRPMPVSFQRKLQALRKDVVKRTIFSPRGRVIRSPRKLGPIADLFSRTVGALT